MIKKRFLTNCLFLFFAACWGVTFPITEYAIKYIDPYLFVGIRFILGGLLLLPFIINRFNNYKKLIIFGAILGVLNSSIYTFEALSLVYISSPQSAFLTGSNIIIIPFLSYLLRMTIKLEKIDIISSLIGLVGLYFLININGCFGFNLGTIFAILCSISIAFSIILVQHLSYKKLDEFMLTFLQLIFTAPIPFVLYLYLGEQNHVIWSYNTILAIGFTSVFATTIPLLGQIKFQHYSTASQTGLIFSLEPVFATLFAYYIFNTTISYFTIIGGILMFISVCLPVINDFLKHH